ncbi:DNA repair protein RecO [Eupransor demetentiae]|uniref:DNA repair protein RecO n=1 Tax=Eupransor demetentiae TaxID=3109584 RepID=A0ABP0EP30_9LACO|nr:Recombinational DNA repair protein RecO (RecF pathway) (RecO) [Lactobacillaceae bacterium LMG 33000]
MAIMHGVVLYTRPYRDNDLLVRMLTQEAGLRTFLARGAKKNNSKLAAGVQPYTLNSFEGKLPKQQEGLGYLNSIQSSHYFRTVVEDLNISAYVALIAKLIDLSFEEGQPIEDWYDKFCQALEKLDQGLDPQIITNIFEIQLLKPLGVEPNLRADPIDGQMDGQFDYSEKYNGIIAENHYYLDDNRLHLDQKTIFYLRQFSQIKLSQINQIKISPATKRSLQKVIDYIYDQQVGLKPKEKVFIQSMDRWQSDLSRLVQERNLP